MKLKEHADALNDASIAVEAAVVAAAMDSTRSPRSRATRRRLDLAVRALEAVDALREEAWA